MEKGIGIAAIAIAIISCFIPVVTLFAVWLALLLAAIAAFLGDRVLSVATALICFANVVFMSPLTMIGLFGPDGKPMLIISVVLLFAPFVAMMLKNKQNKEQAPD